MAKDRKPNFLWISFEDTNPRYGCYGDPVARTPTLDRLAAEGCRWTRCFSTAGVCAPARSAIITGMYAISIGTHHMRTTHANRTTPEMPTPYSAVVPHYAKCFTEYLRAAGYYCSNNAKTDYQFTPPLTAWDALGPHAHWRDRPDPDQPFFAVFNPTRTHESGMWPEKCPEPEFDPDAIPLPPYFPDTPVVRQAMARMYTHIAHSDQELAQLLQQLDEDGLSENTYVFHWSDHGPLPRGKRWPYDSGIRVPLIARGPGIEAGQVCGDLVSTVDLGPTMLSLAGIDVPAQMQGRAFLGPQAQPPREYIYASRDRHDEAYDMVRAVRDRRFKYIRNYRPDLPYLAWIPYRNRHPIVQEMWRLHLADELDETQSAMFRYPRPVEELYDTEADPHEIDNLAANPQYQQERDRLRGALDEWLLEKWATWAAWRKAKWCGSGIPMANSRRRLRRCSCPSAPTALGLSRRWKAVHSGGRCWCNSTAPRRALRWRTPWTTIRTGTSTPSRCAWKQGRPPCGPRRSALGTRRAKRPGRPLS